MKIALKFIRPELGNIKLFAKAADEIRAKIPSYSFTFIIPTVIQETCQKQIIGHGITTSQEVKARRIVFDKNLGCTGLLDAVDPSKGYNVIMDFLGSNLELVINSEQLISSMTHSEVVIEGVQDPCDGYGASAENLVLALSKITSVAFVPRYVGATAHLSHPTLKATTLASKYSLNYLYYLAPVDGILDDGIVKPRNANKVLMTMFEATRLPLSWPGRIGGQYQGILVPSNFCKQVFDSSGLSVKVDVLKLGVRTDLYTYSERKLVTGRPFRFLLIFANHALDDDRKNASLVLKAFKAVFANNPNVELIIKISGKLPGHLIDNSVNNIKIINYRAPIEDIVQLYKDCDCLVFPSRGEGYGMPPREAMATGLPCIITNFSALTDIADPNISFSIKPHKLVPAIYPRAESYRHNNGNPLFGEWADVSLEQLIDMMLYVYNNQEQALEKGKNAAKFIHENESTIHTANQLLKYFRGLSG